MRNKKEIEYEEKIRHAWKVKKDKESEQNIIAVIIAIVIALTVFWSIVN